MQLSRSQPYLTNVGITLLVGANKHKWSGVQICVNVASQKNASLSV